MGVQAVAALERSEKKRGDGDSFSLEHRLDLMKQGRRERQEETGAAFQPKAAGPPRPVVDQPVQDQGSSGVLPRIADKENGGHLAP